MYIACDIGGTKFRIAKSNDCISFDEPVIEQTPDNPKEGLKVISETIRNMVGNEEIDGISVGIAGVLNPDHNFLLKSPHLPDWERIPIREHFEEEFNTKVFVENDTDIVGLGEAVDGAGKGFEIVVYITVSTGIGGTKVVKGKFERNQFGFEPGFQILNNETGENFEDLASGTATKEKFNKEPWDVAKEQPEDWDKIENDIAVGLHNSIVHWSPDVVVIGGGMAKDLDADRMRSKIQNIMKIHPEIPEIRIAELGSIGGIHGGFAFLKGELG